MNYENLLYEVADAIATITINRPRVLNALNLATLTDLKAAFTAARDDEAVRVVILLIQAMMLNFTLIDTKNQITRNGLIQTIQT